MVNHAWIKSKRLFTPPSLPGKGVGGVGAPAGRLFLLLLLFLLTTFAAAEPVTDPDVLARLQDLPTAKQFPTDDAVWLLRDMEVTLEPSGALAVRERKLLTLLTTRALGLANWEVPYDKACETLEIHTARTLIGDHAASADPAQMTENALYPGVAWYDALVVRRFPLPAASTGATLEVESLLRRAAPRMPGDLSTRLHLQQSYPVREARWTVRIPADLRLAVRFTGKFTPQVEERVDGAQRVYQWSLRNIPPLRLTEPQTPAMADIVPTARLTTLPNWTPVAAWYRDITTGKDALTADLRRVAELRTAGCADPAAKIAALHKAVRELPYVAVEMGRLSDVPHTADETMRRNYGDCKDKATLLKALLKAVGIESDYVLVRTTERGALDRQLASPAEFNHVILAVKMPAGDRFLDPTIADVPAGQLPPGVEGAEGLLIRGDGALVTLPVSAAADNRTDIRVAVTVKPNGSAEGRATLTFTGQAAIVQRGMLTPLPRDRYKEALEAALAPRLGPDVAVAAVAIDNLLEPDKPLIIRTDFTSNAYLQRAGEQWVGALPVFTYQPNRYRTTKVRTHPFLLRTESSLHLEAIITLPAGYKVVHLPAAASFAGKVGQFKDAATVTGQTLHYTCDMATKRGLFPPEMLPECKKWSALLALEGRNNLQFLVKK